MILILFQSVTGAIAAGLIFLCYWLNAPSWLAASFVVFCVVFVPLAVFFTDHHWIIRTVGFFRPDLKPVELLDFQGKSYYSLACLNGDSWQCPVFWGTKVGSCLLKTDGVVDGPCSFILYWRPMRKTELMMHLFTETHGSWVSKSKSA